MKKIINDPSNVVEEMVTGLAGMYPQYVERIPGTAALVRSDKDSMTGKVGLVSGGGSGHEPAHAGYVGKGMLTAAVCGQVFTSPTPDQIYEAIKAADQGKGVFLIVKNYSGDVMNFDMAKDLAAMDDIEVRSIVVDDDIAVENSLYTQGRRGVAGTVFMHKILGAAADQGASLDEIEELAKAVLPHINTIGVALSAATVPEVGKPGFVLADDEIEYGVGIHSEPGYRREKIKPSKDLAQELLSKIDESLKLSAQLTLRALRNFWATGHNSASSSLTRFSQVQTAWLKPLLWAKTSSTVNLAPWFWATTSSTATALLTCWKTPLRTRKLAGQRFLAITSTIRNASGLLNLTRMATLFPSKKSQLSQRATTP
ncbi:hypothetical protein ME800_16090 [Lactobacillus delbrueckii]|nr:hypothetical protein ME800_16090 [Lactobacillus delbrueckii]